MNPSCSLHDRFIHVLQRSRWALAAAGTVVLASCGGGSSGPEAPAAPGSSGVVADAHLFALDPPATAAPSNRISLTWHAPAPLSSFTVFVQRAAGQAFEAVDAQVNGGSAQFMRGAAHRWDFPTARVRVRGCDAAGQCVDSNDEPLRDALLGGLTPLSADRFGRAFSGVVLSADGNTLVVNARNPYLDLACGRVPGAFLVYQRTAQGRWTLQAEITQSDPGTALFDAMPYALSGDGNTLVVGMVTEPPNGVVQVFARDAAQHWSRQAFIPAPEPARYGSFGEKVAISHDGNRFVVATNSGPVHVFERSAGQWLAGHVIQPGPDTLQLYSGLILAISPDGSSVATPAIFPDGSQGVHVYKACDCAERWQRVAALRSARAPRPAPDDDGFGRALSFSRDGGTLAVGAFRDPGDASNDGTIMNTGSPDSGAVYIFAADAAGAWQRRAFLKARTAPASDQLGAVVSLSGDARVLTAGACGLAAHASGLRRNHRADATLGRPGEVDASLCRFGGNGGAGYVFEADAGGAWAHTAAAIAAPGERSGFGDFTASGMGTFAGGAAFWLSMGADAQTTVLLAPLQSSEGTPDRITVH